MAILYKCKMCGGDLEVGEAAVTGTCLYCGSEQTLPRLDTDERQRLFERAGHHRRNNEYDKALAVYERLLEADATDPEAYWSLLLCKYGVEYVEDPKTRKRVITCNRTLRKSILTDADYEAALSCADGYAKGFYEGEAREIDRIQKTALAIIDGQEPFDIFICFKQTDRAGRPTKESRRAQDIYDALTREGYRVFFSKITLEDKIGTEYEPLIFAALASAKVMVAVGTSKENFDSPWVRNEWSRFLTMMEDDRSKKLIPAYEDMDPYDMPEEFAMLQALDMDSFTFVQDLTRGIDKLLRGSVAGAATQTGATQPITTTASAASAVTPLVKRARLMCEDGDFAKAGDLIEQALNLDPENGEAYFVALMAEMNCREEELLGLLKCDLSKSTNHRKVLRFGDSSLKNRLESLTVQAGNGLAVAQLMDVMQKVAIKRQQEESDAEKRRKEAERKAEEKRISTLKTNLENALNGDRVDDEYSAKRQNEIGVARSSLQAELTKLKTQRAALGFFAGEEKRNLDMRMQQINTRLSELQNELVSLQRTHRQRPQYSWKVLFVDEVGGMMLVTTKDIVAKMSYHQPGGNITWERCTLRSWLNNEFYGSLHPSLKSRIVEVVNQNPNNAQYGVDGGDPTCDKVFLLSIDEVIRYFKNDAERIAKYQNSDSWWWLRSPGYYANFAANVRDDGSVYAGGDYVGNDYRGVRPALWLRL